MLTVASYYKWLPPQDQVDIGYVGLAGRQWWADVAGQHLPKLLGDATLVGRRHGRSLNYEDITSYPIVSAEFDINYCQIWDVPEHRPDGFVYGLVCDIIDREPQFVYYLDHVRPNLVVTLQDTRQDVVDLCEQRGIRCLFLPWFDAKAQPYIEDKTITAMCTGAIGPCYPQRTAIMQYLAAMDRPDVVTSDVWDRRHYPMPCEEYHRNLARAKYFLSGGIFDFQIPAKYIEACNYGACLVCFESPHMAEQGWVDGETYIRLNSVEDIPGIIESDRWREIAPRGQQMVQARHLVEHRAASIRQAYDQWRGGQ